MALSANDMADFIKTSMGKSGTTPPELVGWATAIIDELTNSGLVNNPTGTVIGVCPPSGGPLQSGSASGGVISGLSGSSLASKVVNEVASYDSITSQVSNVCTEIANHIMSIGVVSFSTGNITGTCTNTPVSPGPLTNGAGSGGLISGISGSVLASAMVSSELSFSSSTSELEGFCTGITDYIKNNAEVQYSTGSVIGTCPPGGGPLQGGTGSNGTIS